MSRIQELLKLSKKIAKKARQLIPRSQNRSRIEGGNAGLRTGWTKKDIPTYLNLQITAMRARSSQNKYRWLIDRLVDDNSLLGNRIEGRFDQLFLNDLQKLGLNADDIYRELKSAKRSAKTHHRKGADFLPFEQQESAAKNAVRYRIGNCGENAALAYIMFAEYPGPQGEHGLPALDEDEDQRPVVEKVSAGKGDHAFVVVNRAPGDIQDVDNWLGKGNVIICDPWWFDEGDALRTDDFSDARKRSLMEFIRSWRDHLSVSGDVIRLGCGHSTRYKANATYRDLNYYTNTIEETIGNLRRPKWQSDDAVTNCPLCGKEFGFFTRKHHCRKCGKVVCDDCSKARKNLSFPVIEDGKIPSPTKDPVRVCNAC